jgi:hypothetical protein
LITNKGNKLKTLTINIESCYGIRKLDTTLDFSAAKAVAIYAPNGSMKTSLAQTFHDIASGVDSKDRIFPARPCKRVVKDERGVDLAKESVLVVRPYDEVMGHSAKTSTLLVNAALRREYEELHVEINAAKTTFLNALKEQSGSKKDIEKEISSTFTASDDKFYVALNRIKDEVLNQSDSPFADVPYDLIFDEKVLSLLGTKDFKTAIDGFIKKYNELLATSTYFKKGTFNYYNASTIAKQLAENGFFAAKHSVNLNADSKLEITTQKELEDLIAKEKDAISSDKDLKKKFAEIEKLIQKNATVREFETYLLDHEELLTKLANLPMFKEEVWKSYIKRRFDLYTNLLEKYRAAEVRKNETQLQAARERTQWQEVIEIFNDRFFVPFKLEPVNLIAVVLGQQEILTLGFTFRDSEAQVTVDRKALMESLSTGEKKALYVLNVLFEIEVRKKAGQESLIVVDDIADSFDYKNKYAIIQYLMDISEDSHFKQIILTHNFDFYRTVQSRFVKYGDCFMVSKTSSGVALEKATGIQNVFVKDWKPKFFVDPKKKIASIPFMRNLIEYTKSDGDADFFRLTSLLHWKTDSETITVTDLDAIYNRLFSTTGASPDGTTSVIQLIQAEAVNCLTAPEGINFENKVLLSIATRLAAEQFMIGKISDPTFVATIDSNQTPKLLKKYRALFAAELVSIGILQRVTSMTPENIHLNSFMYEPILDMSDEHLRRLYTDVIGLQ